MNEAATALHRACARGDKPTAVKLLKKHGKELLKQTDPMTQQTALHVCCDNEQEDLLVYILERYSSKIDINVVDKNGWNPLHAACKKGNLPIIELLLNKGGSLRAVTNETVTPLHYFVRNDDSTDPLNHSRIMKQMIQSAFIDSENKHGETPLHQAALSNKFQNVAYLLNAKADPNHATRRGETPLHFATRGNSENSVTLLLQAKADPTLMADNDGTVEALARNLPTTGIIEILEKYAATNGIVLPLCMDEDPENDPKTDSSEEPSSSRKRKKKRKKGSHLNMARSPSTKQREKSREKQIARVTSLRAIDQRQTAKRRTRTDAQELTATGGRERSNSELTDFLTESNTADTSSASLMQRIDMLNRRKEGRGGKSPAPEVIPGSVSSRVSSFEQWSSPASQRKKSDLKTGSRGLSEDTTSVSTVSGDEELMRIDKLKETAASFVDIQAIEEQVADIFTKEEQNNIALEKELVRAQAFPFSELKGETALATVKRGWDCKSCKTSHKEEVPLFLFCGAPLLYDALDSDGRKSAKLSADLCTIGDQYFVRGLIEMIVKLPLNNSRSASTSKDDKDIIQTWGVWILVSKSDFERVIEHWADSEIISMSGTLNNSLPFYSDTLGLPATLSTRDGGLRPLIQITGESELAKDCQNGISSVRFCSLLDASLRTT